MGLGRKAWDAEPTDKSLPSGVSEAIKKQYHYDAAGRLIMVILPKVDDPEDTSADPVHPIYRYYYDIHGNQIAIVDPKGRATLFEYNELGQQTHRYMPFDASASLSDLTNESYMPTYTTIKGLFDILDPQPDFEETWYDEYGRVVKQKDYKGQATLFYYYEPGGFTTGLPGQLRYEWYFKTINDPWPIITNPMPDSSTLSPDSQIDYEYDRLGRKVKETKDTTDDYEYTYDDEGRVTCLDTPQGVINYEYNTITGRKTATWTGETSAVTRTEYSYDDLGRLDGTSLVTRDGESLISDPQIDPEVTSYAYTRNGSRASATLPHGLYSGYAYNELNRLTGIEHKRDITTASGSAYCAFSYSHYANGMRAGITEAVKVGATPTNETRTVVYGYDNLNRLTDEDATSASNGYSIDYTYDLVGNRTLRHVEVNQSDLYTQYEYYPGTDRLKKEIFTNSLAGIIPWGSGRMYAYADGTFKRAGSEERIGRGWAFMLGLPSLWSKVVFIMVMTLIPLMLFWPVLVRYWRIIYHGRTSRKPALSLYHRCLCVLLAYVFLLGPESFQILVQADVAYSQLGTSTWGANGQDFSYTYDANGSVEYKIHADVQNIETMDRTAVETYLSTYSNIDYDLSEYNLQGRLMTLTKRRNSVIETVSYTYNPQDIRIKKVDSATATTTVYLVDPYNPTGYAQVLEETRYDSTPTPLTRLQYTLGEDVISQTESTYISGSFVANNTIRQYDEAVDTMYLLCDGQGSVRQMRRFYRDDSTTYDFQYQGGYSYDAYGVLLQDSSAEAGVTPAQNSNLLYAGEYFDADAQHYYNRARWYNPYCGRFNRTDPFAGSPSDPQSLHKYLYAHCNPVNNIDPTGESIFQTIGVMAINAQLRLMELAPKIAVITWTVTKLALCAFTASTITRMLAWMGWFPDTEWLAKVQVASGAIFFAGFISTSLLNSIPQPRGKVPYGSTSLSKQVQSKRYEEEFFNERNGAVFEYRDDEGKLKTIIRFSQGFVKGGGHAERIIGREIENMGISRFQVTNIYSELQPCNNPGGYCMPYLKEQFPNANISWSFDYLDPTTREQGRQAWKEALRLLSGG